MNITLSVEALAPNPGGIGRYTWELCKGLSSHSDVDLLRFYHSESLVSDPAALLRGELLATSRSRISRYFQKRNVKRALTQGLFHGPNYFLPSGVQCGIITVHDLSVFRFAETHPAERVAAFERHFRDSLYRAVHVVTDTETVRRELIDDFGVQPGKVTSVPLGVDASFAPRSQTDCQAQLGNWGLAYGRFGLCVSTLEPRKGIGELLSAWRRLPSDLRRQYPLVIAGGTGWRNETLLEQIRVGEMEGWLHHLGFVDEQTLPHLYAGAALFCYPSSYEGFGLPPLEAMASGIPVIVSNRSCLPEVSGNAALYIDPANEAEFDEALLRGLTDTTWRAEAVVRGLARARAYTWSRCIDETMAVYRHILAAS